MVVNCSISWMIVLGLFCLGRLLWVFHRHIWNVWLFVFWDYIYFCYTCCIYAFQLILIILGHSWLTCPFVYSVAGQIGSSFVPTLFTICNISFLILMLISGLLSSILLIMFVAYLVGISMYIFSISKEYILVSLLS